MTGGFDKSGSSSMGIFPPIVRLSDEAATTLLFLISEEFANQLCRSMAMRNVNTNIPRPKLMMDVINPSVCCALLGLLRLLINFSHPVRWDMEV
jgi:hypothetical protein